MDSDFVTILELPPLVAADNSLVDKGAVARQIFDDGDGIAAAVFCENQAVAIGDDIFADNEI